MRNFHDDCRPFPIQGEYHVANPCTIPWWIAEIAYEWYSQRFGTDQSLQQLADRGGFGRDELIGLIRKTL